MKRNIIIIDEEKCNGCGDCIIGCPEGALEIADGKARLAKENYCDGLGACIGNCPQGAITVEQREAEEYSELSVIENISKQGKETINAHLTHLSEHNETEYLNIALDYLKKNGISFDFVEKPKEVFQGCSGSQLSQWPVQLHLVPPSAPYFKNANLLIAADCVPFAFGNFHNELLKDKAVITFCPKLDNSTDFYIDKLTQIIKENDLKSITIAHMEVPCCFGTVQIVKKALEKSDKEIPIKEVVISIQGNLSKK